MGTDVMKTIAEAPDRSAPLRRIIEQSRSRRMMDGIRQAGEPVDLLEVGCADPARFLLPLCRSYTGCDYSERALEVARARLADVEPPIELVQGDIHRLPFDDARFTAVFSAHLLYRIEHRDAQAAALREMARVLAPGGALVLVTANPRPLLFPARALERLVMDSPLWSLLDRIRPLPLEPYLPMPVGWIVGQLRAAGLSASLEVDALPSEAFERSITERRAIGRLLWRGIAHLDAHHPALAARLGCFVTITATRPHSEHSVNRPAQPATTREMATPDRTILQTYTTSAPAPSPAAAQLAPPTEPIATSDPEV